MEKAEIVDGTGPTPLPDMTPYIQNLQNKIGRLSDVINEKLDVLKAQETALRASDALAAGYTHMNRELGEFVELLLEEKAEAESPSTEACSSRTAGDAVAAPAFLERLLVACASGDLAEVASLWTERSRSSTTSPSPSLEAEEEVAAWRHGLFEAFQNGHTEIVRFLAASTTWSTLSLQEFCHYYGQLKDEERRRRILPSLRIIVNSTAEDVQP